MNAVKRVASALVVLSGAVISLSLSGCATNYPISKPVRDQARQVTFGEVRANPDGTRGTVVIWGGRIINVANNANGSSVYIVCLPIDSDEKPVSYGPSPGRFIATSSNFLEPTMLPQNQRITVAGSLDGVRTEKLGNMEYAYPVLNIKELHVWPAEAGEDYPDYSSYPYYYPYGYYGPNWNWGWGWGWGPGWGWWWGYPYYPYGGFNHGFHSFHGGFHSGGSFNGGFHGGGGGSSGGSFHGGQSGGGGGGGFHGGEGGGGHH